MRRHWRRRPCRIAHPAGESGERKPDCVTACAHRARFVAGRTLRWLYACRGTGVRVPRRGCARVHISMSMAREGATVGQMVAQRLTVVVVGAQERVRACSLHGEQSICGGDGSVTSRSRMHIRGESPMQIRCGTLEAPCDQFTR